jgi:hypothetical protein
MFTNSLNGLSVFQPLLLFRKTRTRMTRRPKLDRLVSNLKSQISFYVTRRLVTANTHWLAFFACRKD